MGLGETGRKRKKQGGSSYLEFFAYIKKKIFRGVLATEGKRSVKIMKDLGEVTY
jgi:hypothetical protein